MVVAVAAAAAVVVVVVVVIPGASVVAVVVARLLIVHPCLDMALSADRRDLPRQAHAPFNDHAPILNLHET
eukprot:14727226-Alexandrium_andersonii.AAC.1